MTPKPGPLSENGLKHKPRLKYSLPSEIADAVQVTYNEEGKYDELQRQELQEQNDFRAMLRNEKLPFGFRQLPTARVFVITNHILGAYGLYLILTGHFSCRVLLFQFVYSYMGALGTTVGAHRYWTHKSFKAKLPLRILLMMMQSITGQWSIYKWCLDHRIHHKYTDTDKDPHNIQRGFWFSQLFWYISRKHPDHKEKLKTFDMPDLERDPVVVFQARYYLLMVAIFYGVLPTHLVMFLSGLPWIQVFPLNCFRWVYNTHISSAVNSFAHLYGNKPFDKEITPTDNGIVSVFAVGEGWHNYHHTFPWDYKTSEFGWKINVSTVFIDFFAWLGWAYDLKTVSQEMLLKKVKRTGDGSHWSNHHHHHHDKQQAKDIIQEDQSNLAWGWGDEAISDECKEMTLILNPMSNCPTDPKLTILDQLQKCTL